MTDQSRQTKVLLALIASMLIGGAILYTIKPHPLSASPFCLSRYYRLAPVEDSVSRRFVPYPERWKRIEIYYSNGSDSRNRTAPGSDGPAKQSTAPRRHIDNKRADCHFVVCDGYVGNDGQIQSTENWQSQWPASRVSPNRTEPIGENKRTIYICIATNSESTAPSDFQIRRTEALVEELCRRFDIRSEAILCPNS